MTGGVRDGVVVFGVGFRDACAGNTLNLLGVGEAVLLAELAQVLLDVGARRARMAFSTRGVSSIPGIFCFAC